MIRDTIHDWLEAHPNVAGYVFVATVYLSYASDVTINGAGGGYQGP